ncbi:uncharacterized protein BX663DRAFT_518741 [Cokeromyces recurvatus]|uniref:uncharacterized protein n=1 Tax=Cokeromyces recurvatus TaxID=90255 RepID=UPI002220E81D|nr:uncharacterized protein BX663DRAFT_522431 [Cokeromyces recurvatus]XP_051380130.1 uncharacterized protein BX663DRAFT_518741 [Cokeromyces recurvatus]KAI7899141.1 hypothetical protein BX663DRAFT_522431 [Cokeromyces recurvatus]KAI7900145.1 hypothetical protein BX663DRAFT_518741 [Cokeromyces recurvatus]
MAVSYNKTVNFPFVKCYNCQSSVRINQLSSHVCLSLESNRISQVSHYNEITNERLSLQDILNIRRNNSRYQPNFNRCCRCYHGNATISIATKLYHSYCLSCFYCRLPFSLPSKRNEIKLSEGQVYCTQHYEVAINRPICATCKKPINASTRPTIAFNNLYFHPEHIRCYYCHKAVDPITTGVQERKGKIYCQTDYNQLFLPSCEYCHHAVQKEAVVSTDGKLKGSWHTYCFKCQMCGIPLLSSENKQQQQQQQQQQQKQYQFYVYNNAPYCQLDYHKLNKSLCHGCSLPIEGYCAQTVNNGWRFHPDCVLYFFLKKK